MLGMMNRNCELEQWGPIYGGESGSRNAARRMTFRRVRRDDFGFVADAQSQPGMISLREFPIPKWTFEILSKIAELMELPENWNSYGAKKIRNSSATGAAALILDIARWKTPKPSVVPTKSGSIQVEWHTRGIDLEIDVEGPGCLHVTFEDSSADEEWEETMGADLTKLVACMDRLSK